MRLVVEVTPSAPAFRQARLEAGRQRPFDGFERLSELRPRLFAEIDQRSLARVAAFERVEQLAEANDERADARLGNHVPAVAADEHRIGRERDALARRRKRHVASGQERVQFALVLAIDPDRLAAVAGGADPLEVDAPGLLA